MNGELEILIEYYEEEKRIMEERLKEALDEEDYLCAYHCRHILYKVLDIRNTLNTFKDKYFWEKENIKGRIERLQKELLNDPLDAITASFLANSQRELEIINSRKENTPNQHSSWFNEFLEKIFAKQMKEFSLGLNERKNLTMHFRRSLSNLQIIIPGYKSLLKKYALYQNDIDRLLSNGFIVKKGGRLVLTLPFKTRDEMNSVKMYLAKIIFEVLTVKGEGYIRY